MKKLTSGRIFVVLVLMSLMTVPVLATDTDLAVPYYQQENDYYCGPAVAQMWTDFHSSFVSQNTLYNYIQDESEVSTPLTEEMDIADFAMTQMNKQDLLQEELKDSTPGKALFVHSLNKKYPDYYLIPFEKNGVPRVVSTIIVKDDMAVFGACAALEDVKSIIKPDLDEAKKVLLDEGYGDQWDSRLVWKPCKQTMSVFMPVWEFSNDINETKYVGYNQFTQQVMVYDKLITKKLMG